MKRVTVQQAKATKRGCSFYGCCSATAISAMTLTRINTGDLPVHHVSRTIAKTPGMKATSLVTCSTRLLEITGSYSESLLFMMDQCVTQNILSHTRDVKTVHLKVMNIHLKLIDQRV